jgi:hypothetical protein
VCLQHTPLPGPFLLLFYNKGADMALMLGVLAPHVTELLIINSSLFI